jgi:large subunit ribosomal protein L6
MSRVGNKPIPIPAGVNVEVAGQSVQVAGPKGKLAWLLPRPITAVVEQGRLVVRRPDEVAQHRALHGMSRALLANMIKGVTDGYEIGLEIYGTGYGAKVDGRRLLLNCGYSGRGVGRMAQFDIPIPAGLEIRIEIPTARGNTEPARFFVVGSDKQAVGQFAAEIRKLRKPEPYLGKGIRYLGEHIRRKAGKVFAGGAAGGG